MTVLPATASALAEETAASLTLADCYRLALKQSEEIAVRTELLTETEGRFQQALSGILPKLFFHSTDKRQDDSGGGSSAFTRRNLPERKFTLTQPLFSGFKEFAAMRGSKSEKRLREFERMRAEQLLLVDVSQAFHLLIEQRQTIQVLDATRGALRERLKELKQREKIGRSRLSELVAARSQLYRVEADWEEAQAAEQVASQLLKFLTGLSAVGELADPGPVLPAPLAEDRSPAMARSQPAVKAAEQTVEIARHELRVARSSFFPTADAETNYYVERSGAAETVEWDASLNVDVPIFQGGAALGASKEAGSALRQAELRLQEARRVAGQEIADAQVEYEGARARVRALTKALEATEESYQMQVQEYRLNLVSNLEVLEVLQLLQDSRRLLIQALQEAHRFYWKLQSYSPETLSRLAQDNHP